MVMEQMLSPFGGNPSPASLRNGTGMALVINLMEVPKSYNSTTGSSQAMILNPLDWSFRNGPFQCQYEGSTEPNIERITQRRGRGWIFWRN
jgi:hypothetical protein